MIFKSENNESSAERIARSKSAAKDRPAKDRRKDAKDQVTAAAALDRESSRSKKMTEQEIIQKVLRNYDWRVRPYGMNDSAGDTGGPVLVNVNFLLRSISKIDDVNMEYSAQFTFREQWVDPRLAYEQLFPGRELPEFVVLATTDTSQQIWMPDTFFQNEKDARKHNIDKPNVLIRIHKDGKILYSVRLSLVLSCPMNLEYYPLDKQKCLIDLASYAYTTDDIKYEWKEENPVQLKGGLKNSLPSFDLQEVNTGYCTSRTNTGEYSCLRTQLILRREFSYYLLQLYIPSFMLVIVSWVSFWLDKDSVPARVTLGVTTLLTMTTQSSGINAKLPPVSYTKAIDVWIGVCLAFIFGALLEFALVNYAARRDIMDPAIRRGRRGRFLHAPQIQEEPLLDQDNSAFMMASGINAKLPPVSYTKAIDVWIGVCLAFIFSALLEFALVNYFGRLEFLRKERKKSGASLLPPAPIQRITAVPVERNPCPQCEFESQSLATTALLLYIPSMMLVIASWVNFWIDKDAVPARVSLGITTLLTMTTQASGIQAKLPPVSYTKAIDVWIGTCLGFLFCALLEYALVNYAGRVECMEKERRKQFTSLLPSPPPIVSSNNQLPKATPLQALLMNSMQAACKLNSNEANAMNAPIPKLAGPIDTTRKKRHKVIFAQLSCFRLLKRYRETSKRIDVASRFLFPVAFFLFNVIYWTVYLV